MADMTSSRATYKLQVLASLNFKIWSEYVATTICSLRQDIVRLMDRDSDLQARYGQVGPRQLLSKLQSK